MQSEEQIIMEEGDGHITRTTSRDEGEGDEDDEEQAQRAQARGALLHGGRMRGDRASRRSGVVIAAMPWLNKRRLKLSSTDK
jgi:hypothetical protein